MARGQTTPATLARMTMANSWRALQSWAGTEKRHPDGFWTQGFTTKFRSFFRKHGFPRFSQGCMTNVVRFEIPVGIPSGLGRDMEVGSHENDMLKVAYITNE